MDHPRRDYIDARIAGGAALTPAGLPADPPLPGPIAAGDGSLAPVLTIP